MEIALLRDARRALRDGQPSGALALLDEHARRFPSGALAEDRAAERVFALCAQGEVAQARAEGIRFLTAHPRSPYADAVRGSCGAPRAPGGATGGPN
jgi:outer membrane protein assembly factor BamD (BamD/ComL family)